MITKHKLAERLKKMREDRELSQEELAAKSSGTATLAIILLV